MQESEPFKDLIAKRLLEKASEKQTGAKVAQIPVAEDKEETQIELREETLPAADFVKIEKNLAELVLFTPSSRRIKNVKSKTVTFTRQVEGTKVEARATIVPAAIYGLPVTADQDKYLALQKIINGIQKEQGKVINPVSFTSAELLRLLQNYRDSGKNYKEVDEWLDTMSSTTIISEGAVFLSGKKVWAKDRFRVFERAVSFGKELEAGKIADKNYVWLSAWQLENINNNHQLPIDFETYRQLKNHIAKALVPLLQIWLYATRAEGSFEKRYDELCQMLNIRQYRHLSEIKRNFAPSLEELKSYGYLSDWRIEKTTDFKGYKIVFVHGEKFHRDRRRRLAQKQQVSPENGSKQVPRPEEIAIPEGVDLSLLNELLKRGIPQDRILLLLEKLAPGQQPLDQLEWGDYLIAQAPPGKYHNPTGFYIHLIKENITPPETFESSRKKRLRDEAQRTQEREKQELARLELAYEDYQKHQTDSHIAANYPEQQYLALVQAKILDLRQQYKMFSTWKEEDLMRTATSAVRSDLARKIAFISFEEFCEMECKRSPEPEPLKQGTGEPSSSTEAQIPFTA